MGLFDYVQCEMELPKLSISGNFTFDEEHHFQTKDIDNCLGDFKLGSDKVLYEKIVEYEKRELSDEERKDRDGGFWHPMWDMEPISHEWVRKDFTGYISFYDHIHDVDENHDAWVEYCVHVHEGNVEGDIELKECNLESSHKRKEDSARWEKRVKERSEYEKKWRYRFFGRYWNSTIRFIFHNINKLLNWLSSLRTFMWKVERFFKF